MGEAEGVAADCGELCYRAGRGKEVVAEGFGDTEVADDAGAHPIAIASRAAVDDTVMAQPH